MVIILENKSWPFRLVFQSLVCIMGSLLFSSLFLRTKSKARRSLWSDSSLWSVPGADPRLNPPRRQGFHGAFLSVWFHSLCVWADATSALSPLLSSFHVFRAELFCFSRDVLGKLPNCKEMAPRKISYLLVGLKARERCISVQEKLPLRADVSSELLSRTFQHLCSSCLSW